MTESPQQAESFVKGRSLTAEHFASLDYSSWKSIDVSLNYPFDGQHTNGVLYRSQTMEDKWDLYLHDDHLYFVRSWTGAVAYRLTVSFGEGFVEARCLSFDEEPGADAQYYLREADFVLRSLLYRQLIPHPIPDAIVHAPREAISMYSYKWHGRWAYFATTSDMTNRLRESLK